MPRREIAATEEVRSFCGWDWLRALLDVAQDEIDVGLVAVTFETGGRISEVLVLRPEQFEIIRAFGHDFVLVRDMLVLKHRKVDTRVVPILAREPLVKSMLEYVRVVREEGREKLFELSRVAAFKRFRRLGRELGGYIPGTLKKDGSRPLLAEELTPHILRAERASQLAEEYAFDEMALKQFFGWRPKKQSMAQKYASLGWRGLAYRMVFHKFLSQALMMAEGRSLV